MKLGILREPFNFASLLLPLVPFCPSLVKSITHSFLLLPFLLIFSSLPLYLSRLVAVCLLRYLHGLLSGIFPPLFSLAFHPSIQHLTTVAV